MGFRTHFFILATASIARVLLTLALASFVFGNVHTVAGWNLDRMILLTGSYSLVISLLSFLFETNMMRLSQLVNRGELDFVLIKPIDSQFYVSTRYVTLTEGPAIVVAMVMVLAGGARLELHPTAGDILAYATLISSAIVAFYALWFMTVTFVLWTGRIQNIAHLIEPFMGLARVPIDVFTGPLKPLFTFVLPIALIGTLPAKALLGLFEPAMIGYAIAFALGAAWLSHRFWNYSLTRYSSASS